MRRLLLVVLVLLLSLPIAAQDSAAPGPLVEHNGQELFLSGINLAWVNFARDLTSFDEVRFVAALDEIAAARGNTMRWWLHTNGAASPVYGEDGKITGLNPMELENLERALDLAYERGILIMPTLWSHDMMNVVEGVPTEANKLLIEDPEYTQAYIDNVLTPMVTALAGHPAIVAWEIFNEPEGVTDLGWTDERTDMASIQQFVNLLAGAIHRADPEAKVTNGSWNIQVLTDIEPFFNYYTDERLIEAGGDPDGTLDFYTVHYYPEWFDETTSPFHNPYSHWELDKPLVVAEFPAKAIADLGMGFRPSRVLPNSMVAYEYLLENGYAGALSWMFYASDHGKMLDAAPGMLRVSNLAPENIKVEIGEIDRIPTIAQPIENLVVNNDVPGIENYVDLNTVFADAEGQPLSFEVIGNSNAELVQTAVSADGALSLTFAVGTTGTANLRVRATDAAGNTSNAAFTVQVVDPNRGNVALGKTAVSTSVESTAYAPELATDGLPNTRWSSEYADGQTLTVDLGGVFNVSQVVLRWETAFGQNYEVQVWDGANWQTVVAEPNSDGQIDDIALPEPVDTRYVRLNAITRGTEWGFSLWEFEIYGTSVEGGDAALETAPLEIAAAGGETDAPAMTAVETLVNGFEADTEGFTLADYWAGGTGLAVSTEAASEGAQSLALHVVTTGGSWQEGGVFVQPEGGLDWSAYDQLAVDIFVPEGAEGFISQVFVKTGADWTWANTPDTPLIAGQWTTVVAGLSALGDMSAVNEYGIKIGSSTAVFDGDILIDNLRLIDVEEAAPTEAVETVSEETLLNGFEADTEGFTLANYWAGGTGLAVSTEAASEGAQSLALTVAVTGGGTWQEGGVFVQPEGGLDWSAYNQLAVDIFVPEGADGFISQIFVKTGADWTWANTPDTALVPGEWTTVTADLSALGDMTAVNEYGVKAGSSTGVLDGDILIDNVRLIAISEAPAEVPAAEAGTETLFAGFEAGEEGWALADYWAGGTGIGVSAENATEGAQSLALDVVTSGGGTWQEGGVFIQPESGLDWSAYSQLKVDIYLPEGADGFLSQIFMKTGADWTWANTPDTPLVPGEWTTVTADLSAMGDLTAVYEIGVKAGSSVGALDGQILIDNVRLVAAGDAATPTETSGTVTPEVTAIIAVTPLQEGVGQYGLIEFVVEMDAVYNNPYDPTDIRIDGRFTAPSGEVVIVPGFFYEEFAYSCSIPVSTGETSWRLRFTPTEAGEYSVRVLGTTLSGVTRSAPVAFTVAESDNPGFVRVDSRNSRYMAFDDGSPYYPIGLNIGWSTGNTIADYETWLSALSGAGGNFIRVWMASWDLGIEWVDTGLGNYDRRQSNAYELDRVVQTAAENDIYIMLSLLNHGAFSTSTNPEWDRNPYNSANGGPCDEPACFADHPDAVKYWNQRLRYIVARWGYSPNIMSWEFWNEVNWTPLASEPVLGPWMQRSAAVLRSLDPYDHLLTTSGSQMAHGEVWKDLDYTQDHYYDLTDFPRHFNNIIPQWAEAYPDKPYLVGEFGSPLEIDNEGVLLHLGIWSPVMNGAAGTGMTWWWDNYVHPNNLWDKLFNGISAFLAGEDLAAQEWSLADAEFAERTRARVYGLQTADSTLLWVASRDYSNDYLRKAYNDNLRNKVEDPNAIEFPPVEGAVLLVNGLTDGAYSVEIWDTIAGEIIETHSLDSAGGVLTVPLPAFDASIALKVKPQE